LRDKGCAWPGCPQGMVAGPHRRRRPPRVHPARIHRSAAKTAAQHDPPTVKPTIARRNRGTAGRATDTPAQTSQERGIATLRSLITAGGGQGARVPAPPSTPAVRSSYLDRWGRGPSVRKRRWMGWTCVSTRQSADWHACAKIPDRREAKPRDLPLGYTRGSRDRRRLRWLRAADQSVQGPGAPPAPTRIIVHTRSVTPSTAG
jgi:hypothetical protein